MISYQILLWCLLTFLTVANHQAKRSSLHHMTKPEKTGSFVLGLDKTFIKSNNPSIPLWHPKRVIAQQVMASPCYPSQIYLLLFLSKAKRIGKCSSIYTFSRNFVIWETQSSIIIPVKQMQRRVQKWTVETIKLPKI